MLLKAIIAVDCNSCTKPTNMPWNIKQNFWTVQQTVYLQLPLVFRSVIHEHLSNTYTVPPPTLCMGQSESTLLLYYCWYCCSDLTLLAGNKQLWLYCMSNLCRCCTHTVWLGLSRDASRLSTSNTSGLSLCMCTVLYQTYLNFVTVF
jgi:hypothetical protein